MFGIERMTATSGPAANCRSDNVTPAATDRIRRAPAPTAACVAAAASGGFTAIKAALQEDLVDHGAIRKATPQFFALRGKYLNNRYFGRLNRSDASKPPMSATPMLPPPTTASACVFMLIRYRRVFVTVRVRNLPA